MVVLSLISLLLLPIGSLSQSTSSGTVPSKSTSVTSSSSAASTSGSSQISAQSGTSTSGSQILTSVITQSSTSSSKLIPSTRVTSSSSRKATSTKTTSSNRPTSTVRPGTGKRGLAYNDAPLTKLFGRTVNPKSQVSWTYNWHYSPCDNPLNSSCGYNPNLRFVPMLYNSDPYRLDRWANAVEVALANYGTKHLFSFNEPDGCFYGSSCMNLTDAAITYKKYVNPFAGRVLLGAPAITNAGAPHGLDWLKRFMAACKGCHFDFINVHWYSNKYAGATYFKEYMGQVRKLAAGRPIWVTEFALNDENPYTPQENQAFLRDVMSWMDAQPDFAAYAYFMTAKGILVGPKGKAQSTLGHVYDNWWNATATSS